MSLFGIVNGSFLDGDTGSKVDERAPLRPRPLHNATTLSS